MCWQKLRCKHNQPSWQGVYNFLSAFLKRGKTQTPTSVLAMILNHLMARLQPWSFVECGVSLHCHSWLGLVAPYTALTTGQIEVWHLNCMQTKNLQCTFSIFLVEELYCELNYHDQKIRRTPTHDRQKLWTAVSTLLGLISCVYRDLPHCGSNQRSHLIESIKLCMNCWI